MSIAERKQRERETCRSLILNTAKRLFFREGFLSVTVEKIAREAELAKGSIYLHFQSKEEIYTQILLEEINSFYRQIEFLETPEAQASKRLLQFSEIYLELFLHNRELFRIMMNFQLYPDRRTLPEALNAQLRQSMKKNIDLIERIFEQGILAGEFAAGAPPFLCRNIYWGLLNGIISHYLFAPPEEKGDERLRIILDAGLAVFMNGLHHYEGVPAVGVSK